MKLASSGCSFELSILGYGQNNSSWRDRNRLRCQISTLWQKQLDHRYTPVQTYELARMLSALVALQNHQVKHVSSTLSEQGLSVDIRALSNDTYSFQIQLDRTLTPSWHPYPDFPVELDILLDAKQLADVIGQLTDQLSEFPER